MAHNPLLQVNISELCGIWPTDISANNQHFMGTNCVPLLADFLVHLSQRLTAELIV